ncbi:hypothetical protein [Dactylosporangium sp. NPDC051484]
MRNGVLSVAVTLAMAIGDERMRRRGRSGRGRPSWLVAAALVLAAG